MRPVAGVFTTPPVIENVVALSRLAGTNTHPTPSLSSISSTHTHAATSADHPTILENTCTYYTRKHLLYDVWLPDVLKRG